MTNEKNFIGIGLLPDLIFRIELNNRITRHRSKWTERERRTNIPTGIIFMIFKCSIDCIEKDSISDRISGLTSFIEIGKKTWTSLFEQFTDDLIIEIINLERNDFCSSLDRSKNEGGGPVANGFARLRIQFALAWEQIQHIIVAIFPRNNWYTTARNYIR